MKASVEITRGSYGFGHDWTLVVEYKEKKQPVTKSFYLGQDGKFCSRVLGMSPRYIVEQIGSGEITKPDVNKRLAKFIIDSLKLTIKQIKGAEAWSLCAQ